MRHEKVYRCCVRSVLCGALMLFAGCLTNYYDKFYVETEPVRASDKMEPSDIVLKTVTTEDEVIDIMEEGYASVGYSSFIAPYTPMSCAVDTALKHGAELVLLDIRFKEEKQYTSVMFLPSYTTGYTYGNVNTTVYGAGGMGTAHGTYSGTTTLMTMSAVPVNRSVEIFNHNAMFFRRINTLGTYGVLWSVPKRLPGEALDAPIKIKVQAVYRGTKAEKAGIKRGAIIKTINGKAIRTRNDIAPFQNGKPIKSMGVTYEK